MKIYQVGGSVRDEFLNIKSKDIDFAVEAESFDVMRKYMIDNGYNIFLEKPEYFTIRAKFPNNHEYKHLVADFALCRIDGHYSDGRRPDKVHHATILEDLSRRDFTINAIAKTAGGEYIDPFNGREDIDKKILRCVGKVRDRFEEDALRALRAIRFTLTKGLKMDEEVMNALQSDWLPPKLAKISVERKREELHKIFAFDTIKGINFISQLPLETQKVIFMDGLWLDPSLKKIKN